MLSEVTVYIIIIITRVSCSNFTTLVLQEDNPVINWSKELSDELHSKLYPLWNRTAGDCLLDSTLQATWGVSDRESTLRRALASSLMDCSSQLVYCSDMLGFLNAILFVLLQVFLQVVSC